MHRESSADSYAENLGRLLDMVREAHDSNLGQLRLREVTELQHYDSKVNKLHAVVKIEPGTGFGFGGINQEDVKILMKDSIFENSDKSGISLYYHMQENDEQRRALLEPLAKGFEQQAKQSKKDNFQKFVASQALPKKVGRPKKKAPSFKKVITSVNHPSLEYVVKKGWKENLETWLSQL